jgi:hypothetical protein
MHPLTDRRLHIRQRADLTFKHNVLEGRHGWLRLTPAYSVKVVEEILAQYDEPLSVLDPFSGTATTPLCAAMHGHSAVSIDINPFLVWFGSVKTSQYDTDTIARSAEIAAEVGRMVEAETVPPDAPPPIANIGRWWDERSLKYLCLTKAALARYASEPVGIGDLLKVAFCKTLIEVSNAAFNHQSLSFKDPKGSAQREFWPDEWLHGNSFLANVNEVLRSAKSNPTGSAQVLLGDSRDLEMLGGNRFDLLATSPPYPNRMSYIRELRPYMYWLGYLVEAREAGEMDWQAIGGTWGIATSRLNDWKPSDQNYCPRDLRAVLENISTADAKSGPVLAKYVGKYFEDMWLHFKSVRKHLKPGAVVHYIVGNSKFYDFLVPVETIYADMLEKAGFHNTQTKVIRKRNSKKELYEFDVTAING